MCENMKSWSHCTIKFYTTSLVTLLIRWIKIPWWNIYLHEWILTRWEIEMDWLHPVSIGSSEYAAENIHRYRNAGENGPPAASTEKELVRAGHIECQPGTIRASRSSRIVEISMMREYSDNTIWSRGRRRIELKRHLSSSAVWIRNAYSNSRAIFISVLKLLNPPGPSLLICPRAPNLSL